MFGIDRTANSQYDRHVDSERLVVDALEGLGVRVSSPASHVRGHPDLVLEPGRVPVYLKRRALVTDDVAARLLAERHPDTGTVLLVVADRVTEKARRLLRDGHAGYYDLRGHIALRAESLVIDTDVPPVIERAGRTAALAGAAGLEVAVELLMQRSAGSSMRELARNLGRSPSTVSEILGALRGDGLVDEGQRVVGTQLFWEVAERWPTTRLHLLEVPTPGQRAHVAEPLGLGLDDPERSTGWALTDSAAALAYGAPLAVRVDHHLDFFVPDRVVVRRAQRLLGVAPSPAEARCSVRVAPVPAVCRNRFVGDTNPTGWPLAHPLFVALDLAQDVGRGREILDTWTPDGRWVRVW